MPIHRLDDHLPSIAPTAWIAPGAQVSGRVTLADDVSVWFNAVLRGDVEALSVGRGSNIQDGAVLHADPGSPTLVGAMVTVGHQAMLHGCSVGDGSLIGIQSIVLNGAVIGRHCLVGAGSLVTEGKVFPEGSLIVGRPAKVVRPLTGEQIAALRQSAERYVANARRYAAGLALVRREGPDGGSAGTLREVVA